MRNSSLALRCGTLAACLVVAVAGAVARLWAAEPSSETLPRDVVVIPARGYRARSTDAQSKLGGRLYSELNCAACHRISNAGGRLGPALDGVGAHRTEEFLLSKLVDGSSHKDEFKRLVGRGRGSDLAHVRVSEESARPLVAYILTLPEPEGGVALSGHSRGARESVVVVGEVFKPAPESRGSRQGEKLFQQSGCLACHAAAGRGGWLGPALDGIGSRRSRESIAAHIEDPQSQALFTGSPPLSEMRRSGLSAEQSRLITEYLLTLRDRNKL